MPIRIRDVAGRGFLSIAPTPGGGGWMDGEDNRSSRMSLSLKPDEAAMEKGGIILGIDVK